MTNVINLQSKETTLYKDAIKNIEFGLHSLESITSLGMFKREYFIVLREKSTKVVLDFTPFSKYLRYYNKSVDTRTDSTIKAKALLIIDFLNYLFFYKYNEFKVTRIEDIKLEHGQSYLQEFIDGTLINYKKKDATPQLKSKAVTITAINEITRFYNYLQRTYKKNVPYIYGCELYRNSREINKRTKEYENVTRSVFKVKGAKYKKKELQIRDLWDEVLAKLFKLCDQHYPELKLALALQAFAGLRASEVCNCRQERAKQGGVKIVRHNGKMISFEVDLTKKLNMRSDFVDVGNIKTPGEQLIYNKYLPTFQKIYENHMKWLDKQNYEKEYCPLFVNPRNGKAMTYKSYYTKYKRLTRLLCEDLLKESDESLRNYGRLLTQYSLSTHALRHWFTVQLVLDGLTPNEIATWRRDSSLESATSYCSKKEALMKRYSKSNDVLFNKILGMKGGI